MSRERRRRRSAELEDWESTENLARDEGLYAVSRQEAMMEGQRMLMDNLREKVTSLEDNCEKLEREKKAIDQLLSTRKEEFQESKDRYRGKIADLEETLKRLEQEKSRLYDRLGLPESERSALQQHDKKLSELQQRLDESELRYHEVVEDNTELRQEIKDLQLEMEELHDQFRDDEHTEFRELQRELEANAKNCRILQFKLRKTERRNEQLEAERTQLEDKLRSIEGRFDESDDKQHIRELEEELKMAKEVSVRLHDELEMIEEKRARYEEELDRMNGVLADSENRRIALQKEVDTLKAELENTQAEPPNPNRLSPVPQSRPKLGELGRSPSTEITQIMKDLQESLEREHDLKEQLSFTEEENSTMRKKILVLEEENESLALQVEKMVAAKAAPSPAAKFFKTGSQSKSSGLQEQQLKIQVELAEQELKLLRRKVEDTSHINDTLIKEIKRLEKRIEKGEKKEDDPELLKMSEEEKMHKLAVDIEKLKWRLMAQDKEPTPHRQKRAGLALKRSLSLDEDTTLDTNDPGELKRQVEIIQHQTYLLRDQVVQAKAENQRLAASGGASLSPVPLGEGEMAAKAHALHAENVQLRDQIKLLDESLRRLSEEFNRAMSESVGDASSTQWHGTLLGKLNAFCLENKILRKKVQEIEATNEKISKELSEKKDKKKLKKEKKEKEKEEKESIKLSKDEMKSRIVTLEAELTEAQAATRKRALDFNRLDVEVSEYRQQRDRMYEDFKRREAELTAEIVTLSKKNLIQKNLLEVITERAQNTQAELYRFLKNRGKSTERGSSVSSSTESMMTDRELDEKLLQRLKGLEHAFAEEKQKLQTAEKNLRVSEDRQTKHEDTVYAHIREKEGLQKELTEAKESLKVAKEKAEESKKKLDKETTTYGKVKKEHEDEVKHLEDKIHKLKKDKDKEDKSSAKHSDQKKELEKQIKEYKKKVEELGNDMKKLQVKLKSAEDGLDKEKKSRQTLQEQVDKLQKQFDTINIENTKGKYTISKLEKEVKNKEQELEMFKKSVEKDMLENKKEQKRKDDLVKQKEEQLHEKEEALKKQTALANELQDKVSDSESKLKSHPNQSAPSTGRTAQLQSEINRGKDEVDKLKSQLKDKESAMKNAQQEMRKRDNQLREKDELLSRLNRKLDERESEIAESGRNLRQTRRKLEEKESQLQDMTSKKEDLEKQLPGSKPSAVPKVEVATTRAGPYWLSQRKPEDEKNKWEREKADLQKEITEKNKSLKEKESQLDEVKRELSQIKGKARAGEGVAIPVVVEDASKSEVKFGAGSRDIVKKFGSSTVEVKSKAAAEKSGMSDAKVAVLQKESEKQLELLQNAKKDLNILKDKYEQGLIRWENEKKEMSEKVKKAEEAGSIVSKLEQTMEELKLKAQEAEKKQKEAENSLSIERTLRPRRGSQEQAPKLSEFKAKFERFGPMKPSAIAAANKAKPTETAKEPEVNIDPALKKLQAQILELEKTREKERKEFVDKLKKVHEGQEADRKAQADKEKKLDERDKEITELQKQLINVKAEQTEQKQHWAEEHRKLLKKLEQSDIEEISTDSSASNTKVIVSKPVSVVRSWASSRLENGAPKVVSVNPGSTTHIKITRSTLRSNSYSS